MKRIFLLVCFFGLFTAPCFSQGLDLDFGITNAQYLCVTTDGSTPVCTNNSCVNGTHYASNGLHLNVTTTVKVAACPNRTTPVTRLIVGDGVTSAVYSVQSAATPTFSPSSPYSGPSTTVSISDATPGTTVKWCTDTGSPQCDPLSGTTYTSAVVMSSSGYIRAIAPAHYEASNHTLYNDSATAVWQGTISGSALAFYPQDVFVTMNGTAAGTNVSTSNLATGTKITANYNSWYSVSAAQKFAASQVSLPASVTVRNDTTYALGYATQSLAHNTATNFSSSELDITSHGNIQVISGWLANLPPNQGESAHYWDLIQGIGQTVPQNAIVQLNNGSPWLECAGYGIEVHGTQPSTIFSTDAAQGSQPCIPVSPGGTYYFTFLVNHGSTGTCDGVAAPCAALAMYTTSGSTFTQVGSNIHLHLGQTDNFGAFLLGNGEEGAVAGTMYFQNIMVDYTNHVWPNLPH